MPEGRVAVVVVLLKEQLRSRSKSVTAQTHLMLFFE